MKRTNFNPFVSESDAVDPNNIFCTFTATFSRCLCVISGNRVICIPLIRHNVFE